MNVITRLLYSAGLSQESSLVIHRIMMGYSQLTLSSLVTFLVTHLSVQQPWRCFKSQHPRGGSSDVGFGRLRMEKAVDCKDGALMSCRYQRGFP